MSKAVMLSIQPKWCELIASGKKTMEVRKTIPKLEPPFKCYVYETKAKDHYAVFHENTIGKVIGEFTCDVIYQYSTGNIEGINISEEDMKAMSCLTRQELIDYEFSSSPKDFCMYRVGLYGLHISDLVIYDEQKELSEFIRLCPEWEKDEFTEKCTACTHFYRTYEECIPACDCEGEIHLSKAPQSWCYVEELSGA